MEHDRMPMGRWPGARFDQAQLSVAMEPSTPRQRRLALGVLAVLLVAAGAVAPFSGRSLAQLDAFAPTTGAIIFMGLRGIEWVSLGSEGPRKLCIS
jgi:hypothetical protein